MNPTPAHPDFARFRPLLAAHGAGLADLDARFLDRDDRHELVYTPFHHVARHARLVIVGITPGPTQVRLAYEAAGRDLRAGLSDADVLSRAKAAAAFGGPMRRNLDRMLDHFGLPALVGVGRAADLWRENCGAIECTSVVPHAAVKAGAMFAGRFAEVLASPVLRRCFEQAFVGALDHLRRDAVFVALGPTPLDALDWCVARGAIRAEQVLGAFAHPSAGAGSQVDVYLGVKAAHDLAEADPVRHRVANLRAAHARMAASVGRLDGAIVARDAAEPVLPVPAAGAPRAVAARPREVRITAVPGGEAAPPPKPSVEGVHEGVHAFVSRGKNKGMLLRPHVHGDGCHVLSATRFERDYVRVPATEAIAPYLAQGLSLRMSAPDQPSLGASLVSAASIHGWKQ